MLYIHIVFHPKCTVVSSNHNLICNIFMLNKRWIVCSFYFALDGIQPQRYKLAGWGLLSRLWFPCILQKKRAEVSAGTALLDVEESWWSQTHLLSQGHVHVQNPDRTPTGSCAVLPVCVFFQVLSRLCAQLRMGAWYLHPLASSTRKRNRKRFLCYWSFMDLPLQATQPSLCN